MKGSKGYEKYGGWGGEKGKGKTPQTGCFECGGNHYARDCQWKESHGPAGQAGGIRSLCSVRKAHGKSSEYKKNELDDKSEIVKEKVEVLIKDAEEEAKQKQCVEKQKKEFEAEWVTVRNKKNNCKISSLTTVMPPGVNAIRNAKWEEIDMAVDSGASETVVSDEMIPNVETEAGVASKRGVQYEVASGELIPNLGEKNFVAVGGNGIK
jgi:hypothetical protein